MDDIGNLAEFKQFRMHFVSQNLRIQYTFHHHVSSDFSVIQLYGFNLK